MSNAHAPFCLLSFQPVENGKANYSGATNALLQLELSFLSHSTADAPPFPSSLLSRYERKHAVQSALAFPDAGVKSLSNSSVDEEDAGHVGTSATRTDPSALFA